MYSDGDVSTNKTVAIGVYLGIPLAFLVALAQTALIPDVRLLGVKPNLFLVFTVAWVLLRDVRQGIILGMIGGIVLEVNSGATFGSILLALSAALGVAALGEINAFQGAWFLKYLVITGATLVYGLVSVTLLGAMGHWLPLGAALVRIILPEMLLHLILMVPVYGLLLWLGRRLEPRTVELE
jgi:rod shape-determining protein MreD